MKVKNDILTDSHSRLSHSHTWKTVSPTTAKCAGGPVGEFYRIPIISSRDAANLPNRVTARRNSGEVELWRDLRRYRVTARKNLLFSSQPEERQAHLTSRAFSKSVMTCCSTYTHCTQYERSACVQFSWNLIVTLHFFLIVEKKCFTLM